MQPNTKKKTNQREREIKVVNSSSIYSSMGGPIRNVHSSQGCRWVCVQFGDDFGLWIWEMKLIFCGWSFPQPFRKKKRKEKKKEEERKENKGKEKKRKGMGRPTYLLLFHMSVPKHKPGAPNLPFVSSYCYCCLDFSMLLVPPAYHV